MRSASSFLDSEMQIKMLEIINQNMLTYANIMLYKKENQELGLELLLTPR